MENTENISVMSEKVSVTVNNVQDDRDKYEDSELSGSFGSERRKFAIKKGQIMSSIMKQ